MNPRIPEIETLINQGRFFEAHNLAGEVLESNPDDLRLMQLFALSMSKSGNPGAAKEYLEPVYLQSKDDPETAGILGGIYKELFVKSEDPQFAIASRDIYLDNYSSTGNHYTGINAATMSVIGGQPSKGKEIASGIIEHLNGSDPDLWEMATLGEAFLLIKDIEQSLHYYQKARKMAGSDWGKINSIYAQLWLLDHYTRVPKEITSIFHPPAVVAFVGHMLDTSDREFSRFPPHIENQVKEAIKLQINQMYTRIGFCSLACGADILFAEAMLEEEGEVNIILPFQKDDFIETSVAHGGENWVNRFEKIINNNSVKYITKEKYLGDDVLFSFMGKVVLGSSILKAKNLHTEPFLITVLSESDVAKKAGGTRDMISLWPAPERVVNINPEQFHVPQAVPVQHLQQEASPTDSDTNPRRRLMYILFADIVGYSKVSEEKSPLFVHFIWGKIASEMKKLFIEPIVLNTMGGMIFSIFSSTRSTLDFAFFLKEIGDKFDWQDAGLSEKINLRIGLHAGPVYFGIDPLSNQKNAYGTHINRAASIQKQTLAGTIYASEQFAAVLALESEDYLCEHVGIINLDGVLGKQEIYKISEK